MATTSDRVKAWVKMRIQSLVKEGLSHEEAAGKAHAQAKKKFGAASGAKKAKAEKESGKPGGKPSGNPFAGNK